MTAIQQGSSQQGTEAQQARDAWDAIAPAYDEVVTPGNILHAEQPLRAVGLRAGERFLDVACGSGALAVPAARLGAEVVAVDFAPTFVERLDQRARREGLDNLQARVMDGHALDLPDDSFDVSGSQHGVSLFPDMPRALAEMVRVTKPGGRVLLVAFGDIRKAEFLSYFIGAAKSVVPDFAGLPLDTPPLPFQCADTGVMAAALTAAGLRDVTIEQTTWRMPFQSAEQYWQWITSSNPIGRRLAGALTQEQGAEVRRVLDGMLRERADGGGAAELHADVNIGIGTA